jgi:hypothetical protein
MSNKIKFRDLRRTTQRRLVRMSSRGIIKWSYRIMINSRFKRRRALTIRINKNKKFMKMFITEKMNCKTISNFKTKKVLLTSLKFKSPLRIPRLKKVWQQGHRSLNLVAK